MADLETGTQKDRQRNKQTNKQTKRQNDRQGGGGGGGDAQWNPVPKANSGHTNKVAG